MANLAPAFDTQFFDGPTLAAGYKLYTYETGTTTPKTTYSDQAGSVPNANPITLDADGRCALWLGSGEYTFALYTRAIGDGGALVKTWNDVASVASGADTLRSDLAEADGADLVGFGVRTVEDKLLENKAAGDYGAVGDGVADDTAEIQLAIGALSDGQVLDFGGKTYFIKNLTVPKNRVTLRNGRFISDGTLTGALFLVTGDGVNFDRIDTYLNPASYSVSVGAIGFDGVTGGSVRRCNLDGCNRSGPNTVQSSLIAVYDSTGVEIDGNTLSNGRFTESILLMDSTECRVTNNRITGNGTSYSGIASDFTPTTGEEIGRHVIANNVVTDFDTSCITVNSAENTVVGNVVSGSASEQGINLGHTGRGAPRSVVVGNVVKDCAGDGIAIADSPGTLVTGNVVSECQEAGISVINASDDVVVEGNTIKDIAGGAADGIRVSSGTEPNYSAIYNNYLKNIDGHGIAGYGGNALDIDGNTFINVHNKSGGLPGGRFVLRWDATTSPAPNKLYFKNNSATSDSSLVGPGPSRGISVVASVAAIDLSMVENDLSAVTGTQLFFVESGSQPTFKDMRKNKRTDDLYIGAATLPSGSASLVVNHGNQTTNGAPRLTYKDANGITRKVHVSTYTTGSFTLAGDAAGSDATVEYEVV